MPAESRENPLLKKGNSDAFFKEKYLTKNNKNPTLPAAMQEQTPTTSRFLDALEKKHSESTRQMADAISFASYRKELPGDMSREF